MIKIIRGWIKDFNKKSTGSGLKKSRCLNLVLICIFLCILTCILIFSCTIHHVYTNMAEKAVSRVYRGCFTRVELEENSDLEEIEYVDESEDMVYDTSDQDSEEVGESYGSNDNGILDNVREDNEYSNEPIDYSDTYETRMTSFWADDGSGTGECTGSGLCSWDFGVDEHGWYTYNGKLVVATATTYLANQGWTVADGVHLYKYWEELVLTIDGIEYDAIILDSCGSSMRTDRVDLFVSGGWAVKDTMIQVRRK